MRAFVTYTELWGAPVDEQWLVSRLQKIPHTTAYRPSAVDPTASTHAWLRQPRRRSGRSLSPRSESGAFDGGEASPFDALTNMIGVAAER